VTAFVLRAEWSEQSACGGPSAYEDDSRALRPPGDCCLELAFPILELKIGHRRVGAQPEEKKRFEMTDRVVTSLPTNGGKMSANPILTPAAS